MSRVIGIDFSTTSAGVAIYTPNVVDPWTTHAVKSAGVRAETDAAFYSRMRELNANVLAIVEPTAADVIGIEGTFRGSGGSEARLHYAWHRFRESFAQWAPFAEIGFQIAPSSLKKFATGNGRAKKPEMVAAVRDRLGFEVRKHDEADAVWIAVAAGHAAGVPIQVKPLPEPVAKKKGARQ